MLREYDTIIADGAERLLSLVEREQHNRHVQEQAVTVATIEDAQAARKADLRGDILAFAVFFLCLASGLSCASLGHLKLAASLMGAPVITAIASWIAKRKQRA